MVSVIFLWDKLNTYIHTLFYDSDNNFEADHAWLTLKKKIKWFESSPGKNGKEENKTGGLLIKKKLRQRKSSPRPSRCSRIKPISPWRKWLECSKQSASPPWQCNTSVIGYKFVMHNTHLTLQAGRHLKLSLWYLIHRPGHQHCPPAESSN